MLFKIYDRVSQSSMPPLEFVNRATAVRGVTRLIAEGRIEDPQDKELYLVGDSDGSQIEIHSLDEAEKVIDLKALVDQKTED
jgi:hypothetical protein